MSKWEMVRLGDVADLITKGTTPTTIGFNFVETGINFVKIESIDVNGKIVIDKLQYIDMDCHNKMSRSQLKENDILFSIAGALGKTALVTSNILPANSNQALAIIRISKKEIYLKYLLLVLQSSLIFKQFDKQKQGVAQLNLSLQNISNLQVPLPSVEEQKKIASELDRINDLIAKRKAQIEKLDLLVKAKFIEMFGDPVTNPMGWEINDIAVIYDIIDGDRGKCYPTQEEFYDEEYCLFLNAGNVTKNGWTFNKVQFITKGKDEALKKGKAQISDIILTTRGTVGNIAEVSEELKYKHIRINSGMVILRKTKEFNNCYFIRYFKNPVIYRRLISGSAQPQLPIANLKKARLLCPPIELQNRFADYVQNIEQNKTKLQAGLAQLELLYKERMQYYFE